MFKHKKSIWLTRRLPALIALLVSVRPSGAAPANFVWIEGEAPATSSPLAKEEGAARDFLSNGKWLHLSIEAGNIEKEVPETGLLLSYSINVAQPGAHEIWNRIGYEASRSAFDWRVDGGEWTTVAPNVPVLDLMELSLWTDVGWLKLGEQQLTAGAHTLEIRLSRTKNEKNEFRNINYASDAILVTPGPFHPNSKYKPGESGRDATDEQATNHVFQLPEPKAAGARSTVKLGGLWEVARHDDNAPGEVATPIKDFPAEAHWKAIRVPGDKNKERPDLIFAHRLWYRTRVNVAASQVGRSFFIEFPQNNLNTTVYVNGTYCGFNKDPFARFSVDVTKGIKAGVNEVWVGIRDAYYGFSAVPEKPMKLRNMFHYPHEWFNKGFMDLDYPVWNCPQSGILNTPEFVAAGSTYVADVFVKPSVAKKELAAEVTVSNPTGQSATGELQWQAVNMQSGAVEKTFPPVPITLAAGQSQMLTVTGKWDNPRLWWPDDPHQYYLRTTVNIGGQPVDVADTKFGFREWAVSADRLKFTLNGVVWHLWAEIGINGKDPQAWLADYRRKNQRTSRFSTAGQASHDAHFWHGMEIKESLDFFDASGVVLRRNTTLDGEVIGYAFSESDEDKRKAHGGSVVKMDLMRNWRDQCVAQVKGERNHPSIQIWTIENEFAYINLINLLGNSPTMDAYEQEIQKCSDAVMAVDPTRTVMIDGGGALKENTLPVHGDHYVAHVDPRYPNLAYEPYPEGGGRGRWKWDMQRPRHIGEDYFATGINPADYALIGGEEPFLGKAQARPAADRFYTILQEGYRWGGYYAAWHFWLGEDTAPNHYTPNAPRAVFVREHDWTFGSGQSVKRTVGIFNDTQYTDPITFTWTLTVAGKKLAGQTKEYTVAPGTSQKFPVTLAMPAVTARQEGQWVLALAVKGKEVFRDVKNISILNTSLVATAPATSVRPATTAKPAGKAKPKPKARPASRAEVSGVETRVSLQMSPRLAAPAATTLSAASLLVFDPNGSVVSYLKSRKVPFTPLNSLENLPATGKVLIIGKNAIDVAESTSSRLAAYALAGRRVIVLEQKNPLKYQALPAEIEAAPDRASNDAAADANAGAGRIAFGEDMDHPALRGLQQKDFFTWGPDEIVYRDAYVKPARGAKSLVQVDKRLLNTALVEVPVGNGLMLLSQLVIGEKLNTNPVAQLLMNNLLNYAATYKLEFRPVAAAVSDNPQLAKVLDASGLQYAKADDALDAISAPGIKLAVVSATPANLKLLADNMAKVKAFMQGGGYLVFNGLTAAGLADYNKLVGFDHMIRTSRRERVTFPPTKSPLTSGLSTGDIVLLTGERIFGWTADEYVVSDMFTGVVDYEDVAPFGKSDNFLYENAVNNFFQADAWKLINNFPAPAQGPFELPFTLPKPQTIGEFTWVGNTLYNPQTKVGLVLDGKDTVAFDVEPNAEPQTFAVNPPRTGQQITLQILAWQNLPDKKNTIGIDNFYLKAKRPPEFYKNVKPMLNIGGMMHYPRGAGGLALVNLLFKETEAVPLNAVKKRAIFATVLRNLKAPFGGAKTVIAGANLRYTPLDLSKQANQFRNERGWFGDKNFTFADIPTGTQTFGGVKYNVYEFPTSPVPTVVMLNGPGVPNNIGSEVKGIPVNQKADALFFLHTARIDQRLNDNDRKAGKKFEMARYIVHYADGQTETVPIYSEIDIEDFKQKTPKAIPGAQLAWVKPFADTEFSAVAYSKQWNNPRPDVAIQSIDLVYGPDKRGVPALIAVTAATGQ